MTYNKPSILAIFATLLLAAGCASTPHGTMYGAELAAPDIETGRGCSDYGVEERVGRTMKVANQKVRFEPNFIQPWQIAEHCPAGSKWGCYHPATGKAYIVGRDHKAYWHEWCHAKLGARHTRSWLVGNDVVHTTVAAAGP